MPYRVQVRRKAQKQLGRVQAQERDRVGAAMYGLADDPRPRGARKMRGTGEAEDWRVRVGDYRIVYRIEEPDPTYTSPEEGALAEEGEAFEGLVTVLDVGHRQGIYG